VGDLCVAIVVMEVLLGSWHTTIMLSSLRLKGSTACVFFEGAVDKKMFTAYMEDMLLPTLHPDDIVIMDNLSAHKNIDASKFASQGITIKYLPAYSPDLNPIEKNVEQDQNQAKRIPGDRC